MTSIKKFIKEYSKEIIEDNAAIFAGAGLSMASGFLSWKELLRDIAIELNLDVDKEPDLIALAQFHVNTHRNRAEINKQIIGKFTERTSETEAHRILARLPIRTFWTTNYDTLIEDSLSKANKKVDKKIDQRSLSTNIPKRDAVVYKMHGDILITSDAVITKDDYEAYNEKRILFTTALQGDLVAKTFLFIGFSFEDPNLGYILSRIRILLGENTRTHYAFFKKLDPKDFDDPASYAYANGRMNLHLEDLKRYSISAVLIESYSEIPVILKQIEQTINLKNVFISGSASDYGSWHSEHAHEFVSMLSERMVVEGYKIISGFGLGIGSFVINSAVQAITKIRNGHISEYLKINPFPFQLSIDEKKEFNQMYRDQILSECGVGIFIFGNKVVDGKIVIGDGVIEEFEIAKSRGLKIIPIGSTGYAAEKIYNQIKEDIEKYQYLKPYMEALGELNDSKKLVDIVVKILSEVSGGK